jgi:hypothetical protein
MKCKKSAIEIHKSKAVALYAMEALEGRGVYLPLIDELSTRWG